MGAVRFSGLAGVGVANKHMIKARSFGESDA
jgi:hypothetical protein